MSEQPLSLPDRLAACGLTHKCLATAARKSYSTARRWMLSGRIEPHEELKAIVKRLRKTNPAAALEIVRDLLDDPTYEFPKQVPAKPVNPLLDETIDAVGTAADVLGLVKRARCERSPGGRRIDPSEKFEIVAMVGELKAEVGDIDLALQMA